LLRRIALFLEIVKLVSGWRMEMGCVVERVYTLGVDNPRKTPALRKQTDDKKGMPTA
jgi:hypothetical protein